MSSQQIERAQPRAMTLRHVVELTGFEPAQIALIARTVAVGAPLEELAVFLHACRQLQLDPLLRQAYWIRRGRPPKGTLQVGIDGYRGLADRQGNYAGSSEPVFRGTIEWVYKGKKKVVPEYCQVTCWKLVQGHRAAFTGEARWVEFCPPEEQAAMWFKMPRHQLAKCAEAQSLRKGWPALLGGIEMSPDADLATDVSVSELPTVEPETDNNNGPDYDAVFGAEDAETSVPIGDDPYKQEQDPKQA